MPALQSALLALAAADSRMFLAPAPLAPQMAQQQALAAGLAAAGPALAEPLLEPLPAAYPAPAPAPASSSTVLAAASAVLFAGAALAAARRPAAAVAEPDLEAAEGAVAVAMLFSSGSKATPKSGARKPLPKKAAAPKRKPAPKPAPKKVAPKRTVSKGTGRSSLMGGSTKTGGAENFAKNLFSKENWVFQAFSILSDLPKNNEKKKTMIDKM